MNDAKARKWKAGVLVRIKDEVRPYGGKNGELRERGERPDGRVYWEVYVIGTNLAPGITKLREYYQDELELL